MAKNDTKTAEPVKQDPLLVEVKKYLDARAAEDPQFAEKYAQEGKSLDECVRYIYGEAHKRAGHSKCVYIAPDEVFCMAVHYYDEKDIKVANLPAGGCEAFSRSRVKTCKKFCGKTFENQNKKLSLRKKPLN